MSELNESPPTDEGNANYGVRQGPTVSGTLSVASEFADVFEDDTEPHIPARIDHEVREATRIAPERVDVTDDGFPNPLTECGCGECSDRVDPLADEDAVFGAFSDVLDRQVYAADECPTPRPVTVQRAGEIFHAYQKAAYEREGWSSRLSDVENTHGRYMDAERELLDEWAGEVSTALLSLRVSPVEDVEGSRAINADDAYSWGEVGAAAHGSCESPSSVVSGSGRRWVPPLVLDDRLSDSWGYVRDRLTAHLSDFEWEYCWVVSATESAATPHMHVYLWVRDSEDELSVDHLRPAVQSFVRNTRGASAEYHEVTAGESDAAVVETTPKRQDISEEQAIHVFHQRGDEGFKRNTAGMAYLMHQRPEWTLRRILRGKSSVTGERRSLQGAAFSWASAKAWIGSSAGLDTSSSQ